MPRAGYTSTPCPGCGKIDTVYGRPKDKLCHDCQKIYDEGLAFRKKQAEQTEKIVVRHSNVHHWISRPYLFGNTGRFSTGLTNMLTRTWSRLLMTLVEPTSLGDYHQPPPLITDKKVGWGVKSDFQNDNYLVDAKVRNALNEYDQAVRICLEYAYVTGSLTGADVLRNLNAGLVSSHTYDQKIAELDTKLAALEKFTSEQGEFLGKE